MRVRQVQRMDQEVVGQLQGGQQVRFWAKRGPFGMGYMDNYRQNLGQTEKAKKKPASTGYHMLPDGSAVVIVDSATPGHFRYPQTDQERTKAAKLLAKYQSKMQEMPQEHFEKRHKAIQNKSYQRQKPRQGGRASKPMPPPPPASQPFVVQMQPGPNQGAPHFQVVPASNGQGAWTAGPSAAVRAPAPAPPVNPNVNVEGVWVHRDIYNQYIANHPIRTHCNKCIDALKKPVNDGNDLDKLFKLFNFPHVLNLLQTFKTQFEQKKGVFQLNNVSMHVPFYLRFPPLYDALLNDQMVVNQLNIPDKNAFDTFIAWNTNINHVKEKFNEPGVRSAILNDTQNLFHLIVKNLANIIHHYMIAKKQAEDFWKTTESMMKIVSSSDPSLSHKDEWENLAPLTVMERFAEQVQSGDVVQAPKNPDERKIYYMTELEKYKTNLTTDKSAAACLWMLIEKKVINFGFFKHCVEIAPEFQQCVAKALFKKNLRQTPFEIDTDKIHKYVPNEYELY
jgi:hypothetical protein